MRILIGGYFGAGNLGDELLLKSILFFWRKKNVSPSVVVISHNPQETAGFFGVKAIARNNFLKTLRELYRSDILLLTGGIFQDKTSWRSLYYYLALMLVAKIFSSRIIVYAGGVSDLHPINRQILRIVFQGCSVINVRDELSRKFLLDCGVPGNKISVGADSSFLLSELVVIKKELSPELPTIGFILRPSRRPPITPQLFARLITLLSQSLAARIVLIPFHQRQDRQFLQEIQARAGVKVEMLEWEKPEDIFLYFSRLDLVVSQRLHGIILATMYQIPVLGIGTDPKIRQFLDEIKQKNIITYPVEVQLLLALIADLWEWRGDFRQFYQKTLTNFHQRLKINQKILSSLIS